MSITRPRRRDDHGATAILASFVALILFALAALAVDLGNGVSRKGDTQIQADFAALAGARQIPGDKTESDPSVIAAAEYVWENRPQDDRGSPWAGGPGAVADNLVDEDDSNGEVYFLPEGKFQVVSPRSLVNFGFTGVFSIFGGGVPSNVEVASDAIAQAGTPKGLSAFPLYVVQSSASGPTCDYGSQTLSDAPPPKDPPATVPALYAPSETNDSQLTGIAVEDNADAVASLPKDSTVGSITLSGDFENIIQVGFFSPDSPDSSPVTTPFGPYSEKKGSVSVAVPTSVTGTPGIWYARVFQGVGTKKPSAGDSKWSAALEAQAFSVDSAPPACSADPDGGNFGSVRLFRADSNDSAESNGWLARNAALGLESPLTLATWGGSPNGECSKDANAVISDKSANAETNCIETDTGFPATALIPGLLTGGSDYSGLLETGTSSPDPDGTGGCSRDNDENVMSVGDYDDLNDDLLTCFMREDTTQISTAANPGYSGSPLFETDIYDSPRFGWVPVFAETPEKGTKKYFIVDFRPTFISGQSITATKSSPGAIDDGNGIRVAEKGKDKFESLQVIFLNPESLPDGDVTTPWGPPLGPDLPTAVRLID